MRTAAATGSVEARGVEVPALGLGTWQLRGDTCREAVRHALELGYRHIDTARAYGNEAEVGAGIRDSGVDRDDIFLVTKVRPDAADREGVRREVDASLRELGTDRLDLLLLHRPGRVPIGETMAAFAAERDAGRVVDVGVSNFTAEQVRDAAAEGPLLAVQNEYYPGRSDDGVLAACEELDLIFTAYSPLRRGDLVDADVLEEVAQRHGRTAAQVAIRWLLQQPRVTTIPRSSDAGHRASNLDVFDFELSDDEMARISGR